MAPPTATPTPDFAPLLHNYRLAQKAAYLTLSDDVLNQLPVFAAGEALEDVRVHVEHLRSAGNTEQFEVTQLDVVATYLDGPAVATHEQHERQVLAAGSPICRAVLDLELAYGLVNEGGRWKVEKVRELTRTVLEDTCN